MFPYSTKAKNPEAGTIFPNCPGFRKSLSSALFRYSFSQPMTLTRYTLHDTREPDECQISLTLTRNTSIITLEPFPIHRTINE